MDQCTQGSSQGVHGQQPKHQWAQGAGAGAGTGTTMPSFGLEAVFNTSTRHAPNPRHSSCSPNAGIHKRAWFCEPQRPRSALVKHLWPTNGCAWILRSERIPISCNWWRRCIRDRVHRHMAMAIRWHRNRDRWPTGCGSCKVGQQRYNRMGANIRRCSGTS